VLDCRINDDEIVVGVCFLPGFGEIGGDESNWGGCGARNMHGKGAKLEPQFLCPFGYFFEHGAVIVDELKRAQLLFLPPVHSSFSFILNPSQTGNFVVFCWRNMKRTCRI
jgi:hypothetical protein